MTAPRFLMPGEYLFGPLQEPVATLLGSCVAVTLWHPRCRLLAVSHFVVPRSASDQDDTRSGEAVFARLQRDMVRHRTAPEEYRKGLYGGGSCLQPGQRNSLQIGLIKVARRESSHRERMFPRKSPMCTPKELDVCRCLSLL